MTRISRKSCSHNFSIKAIGGSRISQSSGGANLLFCPIFPPNCMKMKKKMDPGNPPTVKWGRQPIILPNFPPKLHENEKKEWTQGNPPTVKWGRQPIILSNFPPKLHENEKKWTQGNPPMKAKRNNSFEKEYFTFVFFRNNTILSDLTDLAFLCFSLSFIFSHIS